MKRDEKHIFLLDHHITFWKSSTYSRYTYGKIHKISGCPVAKWDIYASLTKETISLNDKSLRGYNVYAQLTEATDILNLLVPGAH